MIKFETINCEGEKVCWLFDSIEAILKEYWTDGMLLPSNDDEVYNETLIVDNKIIKVNTFENIITELSIIYWTNLKI